MTPLLPATELLLFADIAAIQRLKRLYGDIIDRLVRAPEPGDRARLAALFSKDAVLDFHDTLGRYEGREAILNFFVEVLPAATSWMWHSFHSPLITISGDHAEGCWTLHALSVSRADPAAAPRSTYGRYRDRFLRTEEGWCQTHLDFLDETRRA